MTEITQKYLKEIFNYDAETGILTWKVRLSSAAGIGENAGYEWVSSAGKTYILIGLKNKLYRAHRLIWMYVHGKWPNEIDHINGCGTDNKIVNLRNVSRVINSQNQRMSTRNKSGVTGVCWDKRYNKWKAYITVNVKLNNIGSFDSLFDAICARKSAEVEYEFHKNHGMDRPL